MLPSVPSGSLEPLSSQLSFVSKVLGAYLTATVTPLEEAPCALGVNRESGRVSQHTRCLKMKISVGQEQNTKYKSFAQT